jgi:photosystem II stability/assembly factor-like uncharacterized protein
MPAEVELSWAETSAPPKQRYDDVWFRDPSNGWAVNSAGQILKTTDGGDHWQKKFQTPLQPDGRPIYLRCLAFADEMIGWAGTLTPEQRLYRTVDGGEQWAPVDNLPAGAPLKVCGLWAVDRSTIYGSGTNDPLDGAAIIKSVDGGKNWTAINMSAHASNLIDIHFRSPDRGWVVGGFSDKPNATYDDVKPVILFTEDGGRTWEDRLKSMRSEFPEGTWGWKIQFIDEQLGFVSLENMTKAFILNTTDGGKNWKKIPVSENANLEGIGFLDANKGWVGGWGDEDFLTGTTSATTNGGQSWENANRIGKFINRFRFFGNPVTLGYASGRTVYKYARHPAPGPTAMASAKISATQFLAADETTGSYAESDIPIEFTLPAGSRRVTLHIWNRFGKEIRTLLDERTPAPGRRTVRWDRRDDRGGQVRNGVYIYRLTVDDDADSRVIALR